jgi:hypothetical protein
VNGDIVKQSALSDATKKQMYALFSSQFDNISMQQFLHDLDEKDWVLLVHDDTGNLICFSSMLIINTRMDDQDITLIYSGDTVADSATWGNSALSYCWMGAIDWLRRHYDMDRVFWFLLVSGYRTYRFLPVYSQFFYPRHDEPTPDNIQALMHAIATERFNDKYDPETGIVRLDAPAILKDEYRGIPKNRMSDPHIAFFAERNPGHVQGDELLCFAELSESKLTRLGKRMWRKGQKLFPDDA